MFLTLLVVWSVWFWASTCTANSCQWQLVFCCPTLDAFRACWTHSAPTLQFPALYLCVEGFYFAPNIVIFMYYFLQNEPSNCLSSPYSCKRSLCLNAQLWNSFLWGIHKLLVGDSQQNLESQKFKVRSGKKQYNSWSFNCCNKYVSHFQRIELVLPVHYYFL